MNRRGFLTTLGITTAGLVLDPERLLWVPGARTWFLPSLTRPSLTLAQIMAVRFDSFPPNPWAADSHMFDWLAANGAIQGTSSELPLVYNPEW